MVGRRRSRYIGGVREKLYKQDKAESLGHAGVGVGSGGAGTIERMLDGKRPVWHWRLGPGKNSIYPVSHCNSLGWGLGEELGLSHVLECALPSRKQVKNRGDILPRLPPNAENPRRGPTAPA